MEIGEKKKQGRDTMDGLQNLMNGLVATHLELLKWDNLHKVEYQLKIHMIIALNSLMTQQMRSLMNKMKRNWFMLCQGQKSMCLQ
jgi:hypothetical protein